MRVQNINSITPDKCFRARKPKTSGINKVNKAANPTMDGISTAGVWFGFGVGLDLLSRNLRFSKSPFKNSLALNGLIGAGAGAVVFLQDKRKNAISE